MVTQLAYKKRIASTKALQKIFSAQELIAASRIAKARAYAESARPYANSVTRAILTASSHIRFAHPLTSRKAQVKRAGVLVVAANRGMAGAYTSQVLREAGNLMDQLREKDVEPVLYVYGRRAVSYFNFRDIAMEKYWECNTDAPSADISLDISDELIAKFLKRGDDAIDEVYIVYTDYVNMITQRVNVLRLLPAKVQNVTLNTDIDVLGKSFQRDFDISTIGEQKKGVSKEEQEYIKKTNEILLGKDEGVPPLYDFIPDAFTVLDSLFPLYFSTRIHECLLEAAASETAFRQRAMSTATKNSEELVEKLTIQANRARQEAITNELTEIIAASSALD